MYVVFGGFWFTGKMGKISLENKYLTCTLNNNFFLGVWGSSLGRDVQASFGLKGVRKEED